MSERRWTTAFLALLAILLFVESSIRNSFLGFFEWRAPSWGQAALVPVWMAASAAVCYLVFRYRNNWWFYCQGRKIQEGPIETEALARCALLVLGAWLIFDPLLCLMDEIRDSVLKPTFPYEGLGDATTVNWIWYSTSIVLGFLLSRLSCPIAAWFARTQCSRKAVPEDAADTDAGEPKE